MNETLKLSTQQISAVLGVSVNKVMVLKSKGMLYNRLKDVGYEVYSEGKEGRNVYYYCNLVKMSRAAEISTFCKEVFNVNSAEKFRKYYLKRTSLAKGQNMEVEHIITKDRLAELCGVSRQTVSKWDRLLIEQGILIKDGYVYLQIQNKDNEKIVNRISEEAYKNQYKNFVTSKKLYSLCSKEFGTGSLDNNMLEYARREYKSNLDSMYQDNICRIKAYKVNTGHTLHIAAMNVFADITGQTIEPVETVETVSEELETTKKPTVEIEQPTTVSFSDEVQPLTLSLDLEHTTELSTVEPTVEPIVEPIVERPRANPAITKLRNLGLI